MARIGVVDDSPDMRTVLRMVLELDGHTVWEASDGAEVLTAALAGDDILILDARMRGVDGFTVLETLAARGDMPRVIMLSAEQGEPDRLRAEAAGAVAYLTKPFDVPELLGLIARLG